MCWISGNWGIGLVNFVFNIWGCWICFFFLYIDYCKYWWYWFGWWCYLVDGVIFCYWRFLGGSGVFGLFRGIAKGVG